MRWAGLLLLMALAGWLPLWPVALGVGLWLVGGPSRCR
jgi:hypothetical protein